MVQNGNIVHRQENREVRGIEIKGYFSIKDQRYILFVERRWFKNRLYLFECQRNSNFLIPIQIEVSTSTLWEMVKYWLKELNRYLVKKRNKKCG